MFINYYYINAPIIDCDYHYQVTIRIKNTYNQ